MGVPSFLIANTLNLSAAQRLVRLLCPHCKQKEALDEKDLPPAFRGIKAIQVHYMPIGCDQCYYTGYSGRKAIYELITMDQELAEAIKNNVSDVDDLLEQRKIVKLSDKAYQLLTLGETALEEVYALLMN